MVVAGSRVFHSVAFHTVSHSCSLLLISYLVLPPVLLSQTGPKLDSATNAYYLSFLQTRDLGFTPQVLPFTVDQCSLRLLLKFASWHLVCAFPYIPTPSSSGSVASDTLPAKFFDSGFSSFPSFTENGIYIFVIFFFDFEWFYQEMEEMTTYTTIFKIKATEYFLDCCSVPHTPCTLYHLHPEIPLRHSSELKLFSHYFYLQKFAFVFHTTGSELHFIHFVIQASCWGFISTVIFLCPLLIH